MADPSNELSGDAIARVVRERRALIRMRTYYLVGVTGCCVAALQLAISAVLELGANPLRALLFLGSAAALCVAAAMLFRRAQALWREIRTTTIAEPATPPDFSGLSDGSQFATNLNRLRPGPDRQKSTDEPPEA